MKPCKLVCVPTTKYLEYGAYKIPYTENVCGPEKACTAANTACSAKLLGLMKAAIAAEAALKKAAADKAKKKGDHAAAKAASEAAKKELAVALSALKASQALVDAATAKAASAKLQAANDKKTYNDKNEEMRKALVRFETTKKEHLHAQAEYKGKTSAEAKAYKAYTDAVAKHCDAEAVHANLVASIGQKVPKSTCEKGEVNVQKPAGLPCNITPCQPVCTPKTVTLNFGKYSIPYQENVCVDDKTCLSKNAACHKLLFGIMKQAADAEVSLKAAAKAKAAKKGDHAAAAAASAAAKAEAAAAKKSMDAAREELNKSEAAAASAKASSVASSKASSSADSELSDRVKKHNALEKSHLEAQAAFAGAKSKEAKALADFNAAVKAHCDLESSHEKIVYSLNHPKAAQNTCGRTSAPPTGEQLLELFDQME